MVMAMQGADEVTGPQLMAEIGDVRCFTHKDALVAFAGMDAPPFQSGTFDSKSRRPSKRGSPHLRKNLFMVTSTILQHSDPDNPIFLFMDKKEREQAVLCLHHSQRCQVSARLLFQGESASGGTGCWGKHLTENVRPVQPLRKNSSLTSLLFHQVNHFFRTLTEQHPILCERDFFAPSNFTLHYSSEKHTFQVCPFIP